MKSIRSGKIASKDELNALKNRLAKKHGIKKLPTNPTILEFAEKKTPLLLSLLTLKPVRSASGMAVVAVMVKPHKCPGKCVYCPDPVDRAVPKSYTGLEPATMRGLANDFDSFTQTRNRLSQLHATGHSTEKTHLIIMGGTFLSTSPSYQKKFVKGCLEGLTGRKTSSLERAKILAEKAENRLIGLTVETRPDFCGKKEVNRMLSFGATRVELGVQTIYDEIYGKINRGHTVKDVVNATFLLKDSAFKVCYHMMPGLPYSNKRKDLKAFKEIFSNPDFKPDMLKIYPCLVTENSRLKEWVENGAFKPLSDKKAASLIAEAKQFFPRWVRVMRVQRDIPAKAISFGVKKSNLRELVHEELRKKGLKCNCIRCREVGLRESGKASLDDAVYLTETYSASNGTEHFISLEDKKNGLLYGFCRLRVPEKPFRKELKNSALIRELHVFSHSLPLGKKPSEGEFQHRGIGQRLLKIAEEKARESPCCLKSRKIVVLSGIGVKPYYKRFGFRVSGPYMVKKVA